MEIITLEVAVEEAGGKPVIFGTPIVTDGEAHAVVSRMLLNNELHACWDQPTATLAVQRTEPSKLQFLALQFAEKAAQLVEAAEAFGDRLQASDRARPARRAQCASQNQSVWFRA